MAGAGAVGSVPAVSGVAGAGPGSGGGVPVRGRRAGELDHPVVGHAAEHRVAVGDLVGDAVQREHASRGGQRADQRRGDAHPDREPFLRALGGHPVVGQLAQVADEHPGAAAPLLGQADRVHDHELGQLGLHRVGQELQQVLGFARGVDDQHPGTVGRAAEEVDRLDDRLLDEDDPVGTGVLVHEPVHDGGVTEPGVPADEAVGPVRVVYVVADVVGVEAERAGRGRDARGDVTRFLVHDDAAGPDRELVIHVAALLDQQSLTLYTVVRILTCSDLSVDASRGKARPISPMLPMCYVMITLWPARR